MMKQVKPGIRYRILSLLCGIFLSVSAFAQQITVSGHVKDATGEPIIGATIRVVGVTGGVMTDIDGNFSISANADATLDVTYIGYKNQQVKAAPNVVITLEEDSKSIGEVVVIGYGAVKKSDLTGSVTAMKPDSKNKGLVVNPQDLISGKIAGVSVISNDGAPGAGAQIRIRGGSSLNASNDPLIVIDGMAMDNNGVKGLSNPLAMINPQDIESFNVLKDASATAIYGSRGSNGVIIITTKKGRKGMAPTVSYSGSVTAGIKRKTIDVMDGNQYRSFIEGLYGTNSDAYRALGTANTDWQDLIYRTAVSHDHNVTVSGALKNLPYRLSLGYTDQQGILKNTGFQRITGALNLNPSFFDDHLTLNLNAKGMWAKTNHTDVGAVVGNAVSMDPTQDPYAYTSVYHQGLLVNPATGQSVMGQTLQNFGGFFQWTTNGIDGDPTWPFSYNTNATKNPLSILEGHREPAYSRTFIGSADIDYKVHGFEDLRLHATLGADISKGTQYKEVAPFSPTSIYYGSNGYESILKRNLSLSAYAQYFKDFNDRYKNHFDIMAGYEWQHFWRSQNSDYVGVYPSTHTLNAGKELPHQPYRFKTESYLVSFFGRANWSLMDRYYLTATVREDGTSRFKDHWKLYPSVAFAWKINEENVFKDINWLSDLKLRLGYGMTGQQAGDKINDFNWLLLYERNTGSDSYYPLLDDGTLYRPSNYTPDLKWETTTTYNIGLDFGVFDQRLTGSVDWYYRKTDDLLNYAPVEAFVMMRNNAWQNIGSLKNTGVELALSWKAIRSRDFFWTLDYNFTCNQNKITGLNGVSTDGSPVPNTDNIIGIDKYVQYNQVGHPINSFYVYQQVYDKNGKPLENVVVDRNGDGVISTADKYLYKSPAPKYTMGFASRMEYKNWDLGFSMRANIGNYVFDAFMAQNSNMSAGQVWSNSLNFMGNRPVEALERNWQTNENASLLSDYYVHNASFLKLDNITLGYSFANLFKGNSYKGINGRVYATVSNVLTITDYDGIDPEVPNGFDNNIYPRPTSFIFGVNLNF